MHNKPRILFIGDYSRKDYVQMLESAKDYCKFIFLFYTSPKEEDNRFYKTYGEAIYWKDFKSAQQLLAETEPTKVVFLYIESYNHVILNLACKSLAIPTYLLEHGLRADYVFGFDHTISPAREKNFRDKAAYFYKVIRDIKGRINSRNFLINSIELFNSEDQAFVKQFIKVRSKNNYLETFKTIKSSKRLAEYYIGFSPQIYEAYKAHEAPYFGSKATFIGIPYFDKLALLPASTTTRSILLIDQPLAEQGILQWTPANKKAFANELSLICEKHNYILYVKPHPKQDLKLWKGLASQKKCIIIDDTQMVHLATSIPVVLGFYSTLLMAFAAYAHTAVITFENHPAGDFLVSKPLIDACVAHPIHSLQELHNILPDIATLHDQQLPNKAKFIAEWMYKFDGKSGERLRDILLSENL